MDDMYYKYAVLVTQVLKNFVFKNSLGTQF